MLALVALVLAACNGVEEVDPEDPEDPDAPEIDEEPADPDDPEARPDPGTLPTPRAETVHVSVGPDFTNYDSFNPFMPGAAQPGSGYQVAVQEYNWYVNWATGETMMHRVEDFYYEDDNQTLILEVRDGVRWNDGEPFTADDIVFTIEMLRDNPELIGSGHVQETVAAIEAVDDLTVRIELTSPNPRWHRGFAWGGGQTIGETVPRHIWEGEDPTEFDNNPPVDTGPYMLHSTHEDLSMFVWERNDDYWGQDLGLFPEARYFIQSTAPPADVNLSMFLDGTIDTTPPQIFGADLSLAAVTAADGDIQTTNLAAPGVIGIPGFNLSNELLSHREARWAIAKLINRDALANIYPGAEETTPSPRPWPGPDLDVLAPYHAAADAALARIAEEDGFTFEYDPEAAAAILDDLGYTLDGDVRVGPDGNPVELTILTPSQVQEELFVANHLQEELSDIGIQVVVRTADGPSHAVLMEDGEFDIGIGTVDGAVPAGQQGDIAEGLDWYLDRGDDEFVGRRQHYTEPNAEFEAAVADLFATDPEDPAAAELYEEALYQFMRQMWGTPVVERTFTQTQSNLWWTGWPSEDDLYVPPFNWPPTFKFVLFELEPVG
jgi:peptide/nickel transport system substrate-binding protein